MYIWKHPEYASDVTTLAIRDTNFCAVINTLKLVGQDYLEMDPRAST